MSNQNHPMPKTVIQAGVEANLKMKHDRDECRRDQDGGNGLGHYDPGMMQDWRDESRWEEQYGAHAGNSTYLSGTVFATERPVPEDIAKEAQPRKR